LIGLPTAEVEYITSAGIGQATWPKKGGGSVVANIPIAVWKGSEATANAVRKEIARRWGNEESGKYDPQKNCFTYKTWNALGYQVKKGEKAIKSITLVEVADPDATNEKESVVRKLLKTVYLFYYKQVEKKR